MSPLLSKTTTTTAKTTIQALCRSNIGILQQKLMLMDIMTNKFGLSKAKSMYNKICPIVHASIGQHIRHSMDHLTIATNTIIASSSEATNQSNSNTTPKELHYDLRERGGDDEHDMDEAKKRIENTLKQLNIILLEDYSSSQSSSLSSLSSSSEEDVDRDQVVKAYFMLSGDSSTEFILPSTIEREMGFVAHHAIHHMAMVKIIAQTTLDIQGLPANFGRAPSTLVHDNNAVVDIETALSEKNTTTNPQQSP